MRKPGCAERPGLEGPAQNKLKPVNCVTAAAGGPTLSQMKL